MFWEAPTDLIVIWSPNFIETFLQFNPIQSDLDDDLLTPQIQIYQWVSKLK